MRTSASYSNAGLFLVIPANEISTERAFWSERPLSHKERQLMQETSRWVSHAFQNLGRPVFMLTLTCKPARPNGAGGLTFLTHELLGDALDEFFGRVDWLVYKNASRRYEKAVERFVVVEGGGYTGKHIHVHMLVVAPPARYMELMAFITAMLATWRNSPWAKYDVTKKHGVDWREAYDPPMAVQYLLKTGLDAVDWRNTRF